MKDGFFLTGCWLLWSKMNYLYKLLVLRNHHQPITLTGWSILWFSHEIFILGTRLFFLHLGYSCWFGCTSTCLSSNLWHGHYFSIQLFKAILYTIFSIYNYSVIIKGKDVFHLSLQPQNKLLYWCWIITLLHNFISYFWSIHIYTEHFYLYLPNFLIDKVFIHDHSSIIINPTKVRGNRQKSAFVLKSCWHCEGGQSTL